MISIGIDPDIDKCGVAIMIGGKLTSLQSMDFMELLAGIRGNFEYRIVQIMGTDSFNPVTYYVEDVELINVTWNRPGLNQATKLKVAQNVGMVKAVGRLIKQALVRFGQNYELIPPLKGYLKRGKKDAEFFNKLMGWSGRSNADNRDAALLLYPFLKKA